MSANTDGNDPDIRDVVDVISCVALFNEKGKSGNSFPRKEKFRAQLPRKVSEVKSLKTVKETVR